MAMAMLVSALAYGQNMTVTGIVSDSSTGEVVPYASIQLKGTMTGVSTDGYGHYSISVPADGVLIFSSVGYVTQEVPVSGKAKHDILLDPDTQALEETIVVAFGTATKESFTGSATVVKSDDIAKVQSSDATRALEGVVAGVQMTTSSGSLGEYIGQVTIADSDIPDVGPDESGLTDEYVEITGLFGGLQKDFGIEDDTVIFDYYGGVAIYASGNDGDPYAGYPGALNDVICVSAFGPDYLPTNYTNYGPGCNIVAPGGEAYLPPWTSYKGMILSTVPIKVAPSGYGYKQGTSMACPHVSGIAALGLAEKPYMQYGKLYIHPTKTGSGKITIRAVGGGTIVGGDDAIGGMEISQEVSIISRSFKSSNGGWL